MTAVLIIAGICLCWSVLIVGLGAVDDVPTDVHDQRHPSERKEST